MSEENETKEALRLAFRSNAIDALVRAGFTRKMAEMAVDKEHLPKTEEEEKKEKPREVLKRISIEIFVDDE